ncbi:hypothetical protein A9P82_02370 [Arachidicoccus ginsenosidimutans]|nr:hypothetical protein [Arachidicoccus sp. BS20]ANI88248.1 hypothetical protein A9P82_02370 [Arachidicoccus sp. BS20]
MDNGKKKPAAFKATVLLQQLQIQKGLQSSIGFVVWELSVCDIVAIAAFVLVYVSLHGITDNASK